MLFALLLGLAGCSQGLIAAEAGAAETPNDAPSYRVRYHADFRPKDGIARVEIRVRQRERLLRTLDLKFPNTIYSSPEASDGKLSEQDGRLVWRVPEEGGTLSYAVRVDSPRGDGFDARLTDSWALLRMDDLVPTAKAATRGKAVADAQISFSGPEGWSFESRYGRNTLQRHPVPRAAGRRFARPTGWMIAGKVGIRRETISGREIVVAAPLGQGVRRMDMLTYMRYTLPELIRVFPQFPERLLIVSAREEMWRGGLSGPDSLYLHSDRPLVSENATSTLLHELIHVANGISAKDGYDWLVEGVAEFYGLEVLRRTGGIGPERFAKALQDLAAWAEREKAELSHPSKGPSTALAVGELHRLHQALLQSDPDGLDGLVSKLKRRSKVSCRDFLRYAKKREVAFPACENP